MEHDRAFAASASVAYVQPGLIFKVVSAKIRSDDSIAVDFKATDSLSNITPVSTFEPNVISIPSMKSNTFLGLKPSTGITAKSDLLAT